jgi:hypothetical protein
LRHPGEHAVVDRQVPPHQAQSDISNLLQMMTKLYSEIQYCFPSANILIKKNLSSWTPIELFKEIAVLKGYNILIYGNRK